MFYPTPPIPDDDAAIAEEGRRIRAASYANEAIEAVRATGRAWLLAADAMECASYARPTDRRAEGALASYALEAKHAADKCQKAPFAADDLSTAAWRGRGRTIAEYAAKVACCVDDIARDAAYWAKNPGTVE